MKKLLACLLIFFLPAAFWPQNVAADQILGNWISPKQDLIVHCYKEKQRYYSKIIWFKRYYDHTAEEPGAIPESLWLNRVVMESFGYSAGEWAGGSIYNLKNGKRYSAYLQLNGKELKVVGYVFFRVFSETITFMRYLPDQLPPFN